MIDKLTEAECEITERVARRVNVVIEAVEALRRQFEQHIAAEDGAEPVLQDAEALVENMTDVARTWEEVARSRGRMLTRLRAERDALQARVAELEPNAALGALVRRMQRRVIVERLRDGTYSVGLRGEPRVYFRDEERTFAWAADAALGEDVTDAH